MKSISNFILISSFAETFRQIRYNIYPEEYFPRHWAMLFCRFWNLKKNYSTLHCKTYIPSVVATFHFLFTVICNLPFFAIMNIALSIQCSYVSFNKKKYFFVKHIATFGIVTVNQVKVTPSKYQHSVLVQINSLLKNACLWR